MTLLFPSFFRTLWHTNLSAYTPIHQSIHLSLPFFSPPPPPKNAYLHTYILIYTCRGERSWSDVFPSLSAQGLDYESMASSALLERDPSLFWGWYAHRYSYTWEKRRKLLFLFQLSSVELQSYLPLTLSIRIMQDKCLSSHPATQGLRYPEAVVW